MKNPVKTAFKRLKTSILTMFLMASASGAFYLDPASAQVISGTISGTVTDSTGALVPNAPITLTNQGTGSTYTGKSNGSGLFTFTGLPSGDFTITVTSPGFQAFTEKGIHLDPGDSRSLSGLKLKNGSATETVTVQSNETIPLDTGERSDLITQEEIQHLSVEGRDVTELFKTLPGFAQSQNNTNVNNQGYDPSQTSVAGASGYYSTNGSIQGINIHLDGANITDPGAYGGGLININYDQVAEVKVQTSNFGADISNGPVVVSAVTKSGTNDFHGELYTFARTSQLNSSDALNGPTNQAKDPEHEVYPGFAVGGPVLIPGTNFNHNRKFTFFAGAEDYAQRSVYAYGSSGSAIVHALVPTAAMRGGDYSATSIQNFLGPNLCPAPTATTTQTGSPCANTSNYPDVDVVPTFAKDGSAIVNGQLGAQYIDPGAAYIFNTFPTPNNIPTTSNPYNWQSVDYINNDLWQAIGRVDIDINDKNHFFARYDTEHGLAGEPAAVYYNPNGINTPGSGVEHTNAQSTASNLTTILTPTLTNQIFANLVYLDQNFTSADTSILTGYPYQGAYANGRHVLPQIQAYNSPSGSGGLPLAIIPDYSLGPVFAHKFDPEAGDNVTKVWGKHTAEFGVYGQRVTNNQEETNQITNGALTNYYQPGAGSTQADINGQVATFSGNFSTNELEGYFGGYTQQNVLPSVDLYFWNLAFFATDSWKVLPNVTVNYGVRFDHQGLWNDQHGLGVAVFEASQITNPTQGSPYPGFLWHAIDPSIPESGAHSYPFFIEPRFGVAWDIFSTGKTVLRGGWGEYRGHDSWNNISPNVELTENVQTTTEGIASLKAISQLNLPNPSSANTTSYLTTGATYGSSPTDREQPLSDTYSVTLNQALPSHITMFISYVGDNNRFLINGGSTQPVTLANVNAIPIGGLYKPNPDTASPQYGQVLTNLNVNTLPYSPIYTSNAAGASAQQIDEYRPLNTPTVQYQDIDVSNHNLYSNYNGLQAGISRQTGRGLFNVNYTFSKALGIRGAGADDSNGFPTTPFDIAANYGTESFDRRHIFNATYTYEVGSPVQNKFAGQFTNGWEISGITSLQSGADVVAINQPNLALSGSIGQSNLANGTANPNLIPVSNTEYLGTVDVTLQPTVTCSPTAQLAAHQFAKAACFGLPNFLQNGPAILPRLPEPLYFDSDISAQKTFKITDHQNLAFRASAFNFANHPLTTLSSAFTNQYQLNFTNPNSNTFEQASSNTTTGFGVLPFKTGRRIMELSLKYNF